MGSDSKIQWTHHTMNPFLGCSKVHTGCMNCYAESEQAVVMRKGGRVNWGEVWQGGDRVVVADSTWARPLTWARAAAKAGERHRVFCASLSDVLEMPRLPEKWPSGWDDKQITWATERVERIGREMERARERLWDTIRKTFHRCAQCSTDGAICPTKALPLNHFDGAGLDWLLLTKRPENWRLVPEDVRPLVWLGTSIGDQTTADEWGRRLREADGFRVKFYSVEPMVGSVERLPLDGIDWVIVGGESGPKARPCNVEWIRSVVRQCRAAGVPFFVKQLGTRPFETRTLRNARTGNMTGPVPMVLNDHKGGDWDEWSEDLRVREFPR